MYARKHFNILITGANGYLGKYLIESLLLDNKFNINVSTREIKKNKIEKAFCNKIKVFSNNEYILNDYLLYDNIDILIHLAFSRRFRPNSEIAESLVFSKKIFEAAKRKKIKAIINVSTQGVYGNAVGLRDEKTVVAPEMIYSMAKYANEIILDSIASNSNIKICHLRLDSIAGNQNLLPTLVKNAYEKEEIDIIGGKQIFSFLDVRDVALAINMLLDIPIDDWQNIYNLGANNTIYNIKELAKIVAERMEIRFNKNVKINLKETETVTYAGIDSTLFMKDTGWQPKYNIYDIVDKIIDEYLENKNLLLIGE